MAETKARHIANLVEDDGDVKSAHLDNITVTPTAVSDQANTSTGYLDVPAGTTAQRPGSPNAGNLRFNSDEESLEFYTGTAWAKTNEPTPSITSISGNIYAGVSGRSLTITGTDFNTTNVSVEYLDGTSRIEIETNLTPTSSTSITRTIPASVYGKASGTTIGIKVLNAGTVASNIDTSKSVIALPSGGNLDITSVSSYRIHVFNSSDSTGFTNTIANLSVDYLIVAGGGAGGFSESGGGGAGGVVYKTSQTLAVTNFPVVVGLGGTKPGNGSTTADNGDNSSFNSHTANGGGGGGTYGGSGSDLYDGVGGGSGGGAGHNSSSGGGAGTNLQGNDGGAGAGGGNDKGSGGGGGAGSAGGNGTTSSGGTGGNGVDYSTQFGTSYGESGNFASGGVGGRYDSSTNSLAAPIGGGGSIVSGNAENGVANTGGGGAGTNASNTSTPGNGGSGIVLLRYQLP